MMGTVGLSVGISWRLAAWCLWRLFFWSHWTAVEVWLQKKNGSHKKHGLGDKVAVSVYLYLHPYLGEMIQFDDHIFFQMGWFTNHLVEDRIVRNASEASPDSERFEDPGALNSLELQIVAFGEGKGRNLEMMIWWHMMIWYLCNFFRRISNFVFLFLFWFSQIHLGGVASSTGTQRFSPINLGYKQHNNTSPKFPFDLW